MGAIPDFLKPVDPRDAPDSADHLRKQQAIARVCDHIAHGVKADTGMDSPVVTVRMKAAQELEQGDMIVDAHGRILRIVRCSVRDNAVSCYFSIGNMVEIAPAVQVQVFSVAGSSGQGRQPIGTAPRDGTVVDLFVRHGSGTAKRVTDALFHQGRWWDDRSHIVPEDMITHWCPVPL